MALCSTSAAPCCAGFWSTGVAKVLSTRTGRPSAAATTAAMSTSSRVGFAGVSSTTRQVSGRTASATSSGPQNVVSTSSSPEASRWSVPPYNGRTATTWRAPDPACALAARTAAVTAAMPVENATDSAVCSRSASASSKRATVGFHSRW